MARRQLARRVRGRAGARARHRGELPRQGAIVARDERETGDRMLLNLGHTFGHAFEAAAGFSDRLLHGEAVGLGMSLAFEFSARRGLIPKPRPIAPSRILRRSACRPMSSGARPQLARHRFA